MLNEISERQIAHDFTYIWNLKSKQMNKFNKIETESQIQKTNRCRRRGVRGEKKKVWEMKKVQTSSYKINESQE